MTLVIILLKHALAAATFQFFTQKTFRSSSPILILFSTAYALSGFPVAMQLHIMWLDAFYILPILIFLIYRYIRGASALPLIPAYAYLFLTNFYMGYIVGFFTAFCFFFLVLLQCTAFTKRDIFKVLKKILCFTGCVLLAAGCCAAILLPAAAQLLGQRSGDTAGFRLVSITLMDLLNNLFLGEMQSMGTPVPLIYCGLPVMLLIPVFFNSAQIPKKEKTCAAVLLAVYVTATQFAPVYSFFHAFEAPNWYAHRYAFCISFLLLVLAIRAVSANGLPAFKTCVVYAVIFLLFYSLMIPLQRVELAGYTTNSSGWLLLNALFIGLYLLLYYLHSRSYRKKLLPVLLTLTVCMEFVLNGVTLVNRNSFGYESEEKLLRQDSQEGMATALLMAEDKDLYRIRVIDEDMLNAPSYHHYPGVNSFASTDPIQLRQTLSALGIAAPFANIYDQGYTELTDMLFGLRYVVDLSQDTASVKAIPYSLPIGFMTHKDLLAWQPLGNPFVDQENLISSMCGASFRFYTLLTPDDYTMDCQNMDVFAIDDQVIWEHISDAFMNGRITFTVSRSDYGRFYCYIPLETASELDQTSPVITGTASPFRLPMYSKVQSISEASYDALNNSATIQIDFSAGPYFDYLTKGLLLYSYDNSRLSDAYHTLSAHPLQLTAWHDGYLEGDITVSEDCPVFFTSIPYDKGWTLLVDGAPTATAATVNNTFLCSYLYPGTHHIVLQYAAPLSDIGGMCSAICCVLSLLLVLLNYKKAQKESSHENK